MMIQIRKRLYFYWIIAYIFDAKYEKEDLNKVMKNICQNLTQEQWKYVIKLIDQKEL